MNSVLERIHRAELYLLLSFDSICRDHGLSYFLDSGTALGAVRHKGFIPWDDDIDVGMPRKDYEFFLDNAQELLPNDIIIQTSKTDCNYLRHYAKLRLKDTFFPEKDARLHLYKQQGLFIDIFPFDNLPNSILWAKVKIKLSVELYHVISTWRSSVISSSRMRKCFQRVIRRIPEKRIMWLDGVYERFCRSNNIRETKYLTCYFWRMTTYHPFIFEKSRLLPVKETLFEGFPFFSVRDPDYYLSMMYGDYLQLPPIDKQISHLNGSVDFGETSF